METEFALARKHYDLVVIGSGPAGEKGAAQAAYFGKKVALVEKEPVLGGAAANTGTLPSKTLRETALYLSGFRQRGLYGADLKLKDKLTVSDLLFRERLVKESERARIAQNLKRHHVDLYMGAGSFADPHTVRVQPAKSGEIDLEADVILIATGSSPHRPAVYPFHDPRVYDSDTILNLHDVPHSMVVVGGGVIGCEYASMFAALDIHVSLIEGRDRLMGFLDREVSESLRARMETMGITFFMPDRVQSVEDNDSLKIRFKSGAALETETILVASGRSGNTEGLGLDRVGIQPNDRGQICVNEAYQTSVPHIYAAGDVIGFPALASTSMEQARIAMVHAFQLKYKTNLAPVLPYGIYTIPECSMAGETEESLMEKKMPYVAGKASYGANARGQIIGEKDGFLKLLFSDDDDMKLLGVHMIGEQATELIHVGLSAILTGEGAELFIQTCYNYPTLTEMYKYATYDAMGRRAARRAASSPASSSKK
jgi:NAD(P) transhydrogenase